MYRNHINKKFGIKNTKKGGDGRYVVYKIFV